MPVDYRYDPFTDSSQEVDIANELHIIPANSPYTIRLKEVPKRDSPSTVTAKIVTWLAAGIDNLATSITVADAYVWTGATILIGSEQMTVSAGGSTALTVTRAAGGTIATAHSAGEIIYIESSMEEVASAPGSKQFWLDYGTQAGGDETWNTGTVKSNSAQAGYIVSFDYKGIGTLVDKRALTSQNAPLGYQDFYGGVDGAFVSTGNVTQDSDRSIFYYTDYVLNAGHTLTAVGNITIYCTGICVINGTINAKGKGALGGASTIAGGSVAPGENGEIGDGGAGGGTGGTYDTSTGGIGGSSNLGSKVIATSGQTPSATNQALATRYSLTPKAGAGGGSGGTRVNYGAASGAGGNGGAGVIIIANEIKLTGTIDCSGANGGNGVTNSSPGGGGGGGAAILAANRIAVDTGTITVAGGSPGTNGSGTATAGGAGWYKKITL